MKALGTLLIVAGIALAAAGGVQIAMNAPLKPRDPMPAPGERTTLSQALDGIGASLDAEIENGRRKKARAESAYFFIPGVIVIIGGLVVHSRRPQREEQP